jgi:hypothetical protein
VFLADQAQDLEPMQFRQHQIKHDQIGFLGKEKLERPQTILGVNGAVSGVLQKVTHAFGNFGFVLDDQDVWGIRVWHGSRINPSGTG